MTDNGPVEGFIWRCDKDAFLSRHPDAQFTGSQQCDCVSGRRVERLYGYAGLPPHREHCTFEYFDSLPARARLNKQEARRVAGQMATYGYVDNHVHLMLRGDTGQGKSSLAACIVRERIASGVTSLWIDLNDFLAEVYKAQQRMFARERGEDDAPDNPFQFVDKVANVPFLVIDDFGDMLRGKAVTDYQRDRVYDVIRARYEKELPCVITTNLSVDQMVAQFGKRITDRIIESWLCVEMAGESLRIK